MYNSNLRSGSPNNSGNWFSIWPIFAAVLFSLDCLPRLHIPIFGNVCRRWCCRARCAAVLFSEFTSSLFTGRNAAVEGYIHQFLYTYRFLCTPEQLLQFIAEKFVSAARYWTVTVRRGCPENTQPRSESRRSLENILSSPQKTKAVATSHQHARTVLFFSLCQARSQRERRHWEGLPSQFGPPGPLDTRLQTGGLHARVQPRGHAGKVP